MKVHGLIVARSGSKGLPHKNILKINDKTLIEIVCEVAINSKALHKTIITTDSKQYGELAKKSGVEFPWLRPLELAADETSIVDVIFHSIRKEKMVENGFTHIALLQPSSPLVVSDDIKNAIELIEINNFDSIVSGFKLEDKNLSYAFYNENGKCKWLMDYENSFGNRQNLKKIYQRCGNLYILNILKFMQSKKIIDENCGFLEIPVARSICIDEKTDFILAQKFFEDQNEG